MKSVPPVSTEQIREATSKGFVASLGYKSISDTQFDLWLVTERHRVADLAIAKERKRIFISVLANVNKTVEAAKRGDSPIDMTWLFEEIMKEENK
jgi:hypothetical protein